MHPSQGTGTQAGDPLEARAIAETLGKDRTTDLYVGSVKTNIGHLEGAAGVAGIIKAALIVERGLIPQNLWFEKLNPAINLPQHVRIPQETTQWPHDGPRRASVNSFGFGGANAHVVLEDAASYLARTGLTGRHQTVTRSERQTNGIASPEEVSRKHVFVLSSYDQDGVKRVAERLQDHVASATRCQQKELAHTLASKRTAHPWKSFAIANGLGQLSDALRGIPAPIRSSDSTTSRVAFAFTGQGAAWPGMGRALLAYDVYKASITRASELLRSLGSTWDLLDELLNTEHEENLKLAEYSQPVCTAVQIALVDLLRHWQVIPAAVVGHSSGEIAAAYCAGHVTFDTAMTVAWLRGQVSGTVARKNARGAMMAVSVGGDVIRERLQQLTTGNAIVACWNSPKACTVSGDSDAVDELFGQLTADQIGCTKLPIDCAYHSQHMYAVREAYEHALAELPTTHNPEAIPMFSSVTGKLVQPGGLGPSYWVDNLVSPVKFTAAVQALLHHTGAHRASNDREAFASVFLEVGPHSALRTYLLDIFRDVRFSNLSYSTMLRKKFDGDETALQAIAELWTRGCHVELDQVNDIPPNTNMLVNLPPYAWNHSLSFWEESYSSREYRLRPAPRKDLVGYRVPGCTEPTWRNFLRVTENPWIREHQVQGAILYPGAGMVVMAIEAARQIADVNEELLGFELRDVAIVTALRVPDDAKGIEVMVQLHPRRTGTKAGPSSTLYEFTVSSWSADVKEWTSHARGFVSVTYKSSLTPAMVREAELDNLAREKSFREAKKRCSKPARAFLYDNVETIGMKYGDVFRNVETLFAGPSESYGTISIPDTRATMPQQFEYDSVIHPATLDSMLHLLFPSISGSEQSLSEAVVPFSFERIFVSANMPKAPGTTLVGTSSAKKTSYTTWMSQISVTTEDHSQPLVLMEGLGLASVGASSEQPEVRASTFTQVWHPDVDLIAPDMIKQLIYSRTIPNADDDSVLDLLEYVCLVYIHRCLRWFEDEGKHHVPNEGFWKLYVEWMRDRISEFEPISSDPIEVNKKLEAAKTRISTSHSGDITVQMVDRIGSNLSKIFTREVEPLQVMLENDLLYTFYQGAFGASYNSNCAEYVGLIADKRPGLNILEIGAGTGGTTGHILNRLRRDGTSSKASRYYFTDISPGFLAKAADRFTADASIMEYGTLNIENDPLAQGFERESFDLIVCANVLHATKSIQETLQNCKMLLKPGGQLVLSEVTIKRIFCGFIMGPLPGWWLGQDDGRHGGPLLDVPEWDAALKKAGYSGVDLDVRGDREGSKEPVSLIVSTKPGPENNAKSETKFAVIQTADPASSALAEAIVASAKAIGVEAITLDWSQFCEQDIADRYCISLVEWQEPLLVNVLQDAWDRLRQLIQKSAGTLWVTGGAALDCVEPHKSLMVGLARAIRNENAGARLATLDIETAQSIDLMASSASIARVALSHSGGETAEGEYASRSSSILVPRVERTTAVDASLRRYEAKGEPEATSFACCGRPLKLTIKTPGLLDTFRWEEDETYYTPLPTDWIEIEVKAVGLNFKDVLVALGNLNENKLGVDVAGHVTRVGSSVTTLKPGDRVMTASCDTFATFVRFPSQGAIPMPGNMSFEDAASMPLIFLTAYYALVTAGHLERGETILIHAAAGGVGQAAIILAQHIGAEIYATVGSEEKKRLIMEQYQIPEDHIFSSRDLSFAQGVKRMTHGAGVDVVLNSLAGEALRLSWHCLAKFGRFLEIGKADLFANTGLDMQPFLENKSYIGVNLLDFENNPTPRAIKLWADVAQLINSASLQPVQPIQLFTFSEVEKAFRYMQTGKHMGKVVLRVDENDVVPAVPRIPKVGVVEDATYIVAGVGGIGREIGRWLAEKGAQHLVFLSRSAASGAENKAFVQDLRKTYRTNAIAFDCDVGNRAALQTVLYNISDLPPVRGCITGAMVLKDTLFDSMTAEDLRITVGPKVHGTWNLHDLLPKQLDFFVMLSSLAGVMGHRGQGNYGAGNIFQDYFASYRRSLGLRAMTIDIGYLLSVGFVADNDQYVDHVKSMGLRVMHNSDLHGLIATAMEGSDAHPAEVMCGLPFNEYDPKWYWMDDNRFAGLRNLSSGTSSALSSATSLKDDLSQCADMSAATQLISNAMAERLARLMMIPATDVDVVKPLSAYGVDSLVAVEVRNWIAKEMLVEVSVFEIMANVPMSQLAADLAAKSKVVRVGKE